MVGRFPCSFFAWVHPLSDFFSNGLGLGSFLSANAVEEIWACEHDRESECQHDQHFQMHFGFRRMNWVLFDRFHTSLASSIHYAKAFFRRTGVFKFFGSFRFISFSFITFQSMKKNRSSFEYFQGIISGPTLFFLPRLLLLFFLRFSWKLLFLWTWIRGINTATFGLFTLDFSLFTSDWLRLKQITC